MQHHRFTEFQALLALKHTPYLGPRSWKRIMEHFDSAQNAIKNPDVWPVCNLTTAKALQNFKHKHYLKRVQQELEKAVTLGFCDEDKEETGLLFYSDPLYPKRLRQLPDPPLFLYYKGNAGLLSGASIAVVGSRKCTERGLQATRQICEGLSQAGICVISGMAAGIDRQAHVSGLTGPGSSIAVLGAGFSHIYPWKNTDIFEELCQRGLVVTEFAPDITPQARNFPYRNRIVSGLALGVVVAEATIKSGSCITAKAGLEQNREVYAVPGPVDAPAFAGCNHLIAQGASAIHSAGEIILDLAVLIKADMKNMQPSAARVQYHLDNAALAGQNVEPSAPTIPPTLEDEQHRLVWRALAEKKRIHIDCLCRELKWDIAHLSQTLAVMEITGLVRQWPGMYYGLC